MVDFLLDRFRLLAEAPFTTLIHVGWHQRRHFLPVYGLTVLIVFRLLQDFADICWIIDWNAEMI
jgi:hypothetical protein